MATSIFMFTDFFLAHLYNSKKCTPMPSPFRPFWGLLSQKCKIYLKLLKFWLLNQKTSDKFTLGRKAFRQMWRMRTTSFFLINVFTTMLLEDTSRSLLESILCAWITDWKAFGILQITLYMQFIVKSCFYLKFNIIL